MECYDADLAGALNQIVDRKAQTAREVTLKEVNGRPLPIRLRDGLAGAAALANPANREGKLDILEEKIRAFAAKYPKVSGLAALNRDLTAFRTTLGLLQQKDLAALSRHLQTPPETPPFQHHRTWMPRDQLPPEAFADASGVAGALFTQMLPFADPDTLALLERIERAVYAGWPAR